MNNTKKTLSILSLLFLTLTGCRLETDIGEYNTIIDAVKGENMNLSVQEDTPYEFTYEVQKNEESVDLQIMISKGPQNGVLKNCFKPVPTKYVCTYHPNKDYYGTDMVYLSTIDGDQKSQDSSHIKIDIQNVNDVPRIGPDQRFQLLSDSNISFSVNQATDPDQSDEQLIYEIVSAPNQGTLTNCFNQSDKTKCQFSIGNFVGETSFTYRVKDLEGTYSEVSIVSFIVSAKPKPSRTLSASISGYFSGALTIKDLPNGVNKSVSAPRQNLVLTSNIKEGSSYNLSLGVSPAISCSGSQLSGVISNNKAVNIHCQKYACTDTNRLKHTKLCQPLANSIGCIDPNLIKTDNSLCGAVIVYGCMNSEASNYNSNANIDNSQCEFIVPKPMRTLTAKVTGVLSQSLRISDPTNQINKVVSSPTNSLLLTNQIREGSQYNLSLSPLSAYSCSSSGLSAIVTTNATITVHCKKYECTDTTKLDHVKTCTTPNNPLNCISYGNVEHKEALCGPTIVSGCTNENAQNYNPDANLDDGNCQLETPKSALKVKLLGLLENNETVIVAGNSTTIELNSSQIGQTILFSDTLPVQGQYSLSINSQPIGHICSSDDLTGNYVGNGQSKTIELTCKMKACLDNSYEEYPSICSGSNSSNCLDLNYLLADNSNLCQTPVVTTSELTKNIVFEEGQNNVQQVNLVLLVDPSDSMDPINQNILTSFHNLIMGLEGYDVKIFGYNLLWGQYNTVGLSTTFKTTYPSTDTRVDNYGLKNSFTGELSITPDMDQSQLQSISSQLQTSVISQQAQTFTNTVESPLCLIHSLEQTLPENNFNNTTVFDRSNPTYYVLPTNEDDTTVACYQKNTYTKNENVQIRQNSETLQVLLNWTDSQGEPKLTYAYVYNSQHLSNMNYTQYTSSFIGCSQSFKNFLSSNSYVNTESISGTCTVRRTTSSRYQSLSSPSANVCTDAFTQNGIQYPNLKNYLEATQPDKIWTDQCTHTTGFSWGSSQLIPYQGTPQGTALKLSQQGPEKRKVMMFHPKSGSSCSQNSTPRLNSFHSLLPDQSQSYDICGMENNISTYVNNMMGFVNQASGFQLVYNFTVPVGASVNSVELVDGNQVTSIDSSSYIATVSGSQVSIELTGNVQLSQGMQINLIIDN